jgi:outer membrane lipoprotein-sorting protein
MFANLSLANDVNDVNKTIEKLNHAAANLKNLTAKIEYTHVQTLFDTQTVRTGELFYSKDANSALLRINFLTLNQDNSGQQQYKEDYIFDGKKLLRVDYQSKSYVSEQYATDNRIEPFELVQDYFPIVGLAKPQEITQEFQSALNGNILNLVPRENSRFFKAYSKVNVTVDPNLNLPITFNASTTDNEEITIKLMNIDTSKPISKDVFVPAIPADFTRTEKKPGTN